MRIIELIIYLTGLTMLFIGVVKSVKAAGKSRFLIIKKEKEMENWKQEAELQMLLKRVRKFRKIALAGIIVLFITMTKYAYFS